MSEDSYVYWDDKHVYVQCVACHAKNKKGVIWHAAMGYKNKVVCCMEGCGRIIHQGENEKTTSAVQM